jgi:Ca-activated chloride channel family protein
LAARERKFDFPGNLVEKSATSRSPSSKALGDAPRSARSSTRSTCKAKNDELIKSSSPSTKHGILTPYTSFLADENAPAQQLANLGANVDFARREVDRLALSEGVAGVSQRAEKKALQEAGRPQAAASPTFGGAQAAGDARGWAVPAARAEDFAMPCQLLGPRTRSRHRQRQGNNGDRVQNVGNETFLQARQAMDRQ